MPEPSPRAVALRFVAEVWNAGNLDVADVLVHPDDAVPGVGWEPESVKGNVAAFRRAFPDQEWTVEDVVSEGDRVSLRLTLRGTHRGEFRGIPATGRCVTMQEMVFWRVAHGRLREGWFQADALGLRQQLGATSVAADASPAPAATEAAPAPSSGARSP